MSAKLSIIIPAYNEEGAIENIIRRCLSAKKLICERAGLSEVEIIAVNDGSSDKTGEIIEAFRKRGEIESVSYEKNRGYGAAIKSGFKVASGDYLGFLDADGTCDPMFFADLLIRLVAERADISIGSRMGADSKMPGIRRLGNFFYAWFISLVGGVRITDAASGMRVLRKEALIKIYPLPDGMNFTPSMSAKAVMDPDLKIIETPMSYKERIGQSKLHVLKDGFNFFRTVFEVCFFYKPLKIFAFAASILFAVCLFYGVPLTIYYLRHGSILESDIYRIITIIVMSLLGLNLLMLGILGDDVMTIFTGKASLVTRRRNGALAAVGLFLAISGVALNHRAIAEYWTTRTVNVHWVYVLTGGFLVLVGSEIMALAFLRKIFSIYRETLDFRRSQAG
jgi:glycosyltransferase involved in cell wall biosynthesis